MAHSDLLRGMPAGREVACDEVAELARRVGRVLVVLDDDPTGTQSVANLPVLLDWSGESLRWALGLGAPAVYVLTNSRSLSAADAQQRTREVARAALEAAEQVGVRVDFVSRSDSTLRGHFPAETDALGQVIGAATGSPPDGVVLVPAFPDAGRITVDSVHYAGDALAGYTPVGQTEFAADATFGYVSSDLREWVAEKSVGRPRATDVARIDLRTLRTDPAGTVRILRGLTGYQPVVVDIVTEDDLRLLAVALHAATAQGSRLVYRVGPPFVRAMIGQPVTAPLSSAAIAGIGAGPVGAPPERPVEPARGGLVGSPPGGLVRTPSGGPVGSPPERPVEPVRGGLVVIGSHVSLTTRQLERLIERSHPTPFQLDVAALVAGRDEAQVLSIAEGALAALGRGNVVVSTSRILQRVRDADGSLAIARLVSTAIVEVVSQVVAGTRPRFILAKGGITSSDVAARALSMRRAMVRGTMLPGIVSLWEPIDGAARGIPYVVFAGNVGGIESLADVVDALSVQP